MKIEQVKIKDIIHAEYNPRRLTDEQEKHLTDSLSRFGFVDPVIINRHPVANIKKRDGKISTECFVWSTETKEYVDSLSEVVKNG